MSYRAALLCSALFAVATPALAQSEGGASTNSTIEEVVVTARKREESLQSVPVAVTSVTGEQLTQQGIRQPNDLQRIVPSLSVGESLSQNTAAVFSLRGQAPGDVSLTFSQPVGIYEDSVNVPHPVGLSSSLFDITRVEVLKGPQGTLYGRNTTGGAVNIITKNADFNGYHGFVNLEAGNHEDYKATGAINVPIVEDMLALRLAAQYWSREGYGHSKVTGQDLGGDRDDQTYRLSLKADPTPYLTSTTKAEYSKLSRSGQMSTLRALAPIGSTSTSTLAPTEAALESGFSPALLATPAGAAAFLGGGLAALAPYMNGDFFTNGAQTRASDEVEAWHAVEDISWDINDAVTLRSITGYHSVSDFQAVDLDATPFQFNELNLGVGGPITLITGAFPYPYAASTEYHSFTQEFNLSGEAGMLNWLVGAFYNDESGNGAEVPAVFPRVLALAGAPTVNATISDVDSSSWALFTQNDIKFSDKISVTLGARYTDERMKQDSQKFEFNPVNQQFFCSAGAVVPAVPNTPGACPHIHSTTSSSGISYLASFNFQATPATLVYLKTARGFRGGGLQFRSPAAPAFDPEIATDYELGFKSDFFDRRLRTNLAVYQTNYDNKQETVITGNPPTSLTANAADARIQGFEGELNGVILPGWSAYGSVTYLKGEYLAYQGARGADGNLIPGGAGGVEFALPKWRYSIGSRYEHEVGPGVLGGQLDYAWHDKIPQTILSRDFTIPQSLEDEFTSDRGLLNARIDYRLPEYDVTVAVFATNLTDETYQVAGLPGGALGFATGVTQEPRMWGVSIRKAFGDE